MITSHELLGFMSPALAMEIVEHVYAEDKALYRSILKAVGDARKLRPIFLERQPRAIRHQMMLETLSRPVLDPVASNLIRGWLLKKHSSVLVDFLNTLGVAHTEGIADELPDKVEESKLKEAVEVLLAKHPKEVVTVYLHAFNTMNETNWPVLDEILKIDPRLQL